jgi:hypothetical protein
VYLAFVCPLTFLRTIIIFLNIGLSCSSAAVGMVGGKPIRKIPKRNIQQLVAQPSTTSTSTSLYYIKERKKND